MRAVLRSATPRSVRVRILMWVVSLCALALLMAGAAFYLVERELIDRRITASLSQEISEFETFGRTGVDPSTGEPFQSPARLIQAAMSRNVPDEHQALLAFVNGRPRYVQGSRVEALESSREFRAAVNALPKGGSGSVRVDAGTVRFAVKTIRAAGADASAPPAAYVVASFVDGEREELVEAVRSYLLVALVALMVVGLGAWSVSGRLLRPLRDLRMTADQISHSDLTRRIESSGHDDISDLARTFNAMLDRLEDAFAGQRRFLDDAGHELRTPITIVRGHLELMAPGDVDDVASTRALVLDELDRMSRLVDDLVVLARAGRPDFLKARAVDLGSLTDDVLDKARGLGPRTWRCDGRAEAQILADPQRLTQAMLQLAANAVNHTQPGDLVAIGSAVTDGRVVLWVRDDGSGVDPADAERIFERFERGERASTHGAGLGLSIVRAIATAHGGTVRLAPQQERGATFRIELPTSATSTGELAPVRARAEV